MEDKQFKYDIGLSFAGEQRDLVAHVAQELDYRGIRIYYDMFDQASLWGMDLREHFTRLFRDECRFCIVFSSQEYASKMWPNLEMESAIARVMSDKRDYILPVKCDDTIVPGIPYTTGYLNAWDFTPVQISQLAAQRLGICEAPARIEFAFLCTGINMQPKLTVTLPGFNKQHPSQGPLLTLVKVVFCRGENPVAPLEIRATDSNGTLVGQYRGFFTAKGIDREVDRVGFTPLEAEQSYVHGALISQQFKLSSPGTYRIAWYLNEKLQRTSSMLVYGAEEGG